MARQLRLSLQKKAAVKKKLYVKNYQEVPKNGSSFKMAKDSQGRRLFFPLKSQKELDQQNLIFKEDSRNSLLEFNIHEMVRQIEIEKKYEQQMAEEHQLETDGLKPDSLTSDGALWVDKYSPRMYIDLVGDEVRRQLHNFSHTYFI
jgi:hypothetical protein